MKFFSFVWGFLLLALGLMLFLENVIGVGTQQVWNIVGTILAVLLAAWGIRLLFVFFVNKNFWHLLWALVLVITGTLLIFGIYDIFEKLGLAGAERYLRMLPLIFISIMLVGWGTRQVILALFSHPHE